MLTEKSLTITATPDNVPLTRVQQRVSEALNPVLTTPILDGVLIKNYVATTRDASQNSVTLVHNLGRPALGSLLVAYNTRQSYSYNTYSYITPQPLDGTGQSSPTPNSSLVIRFTQPGIPVAGDTMSFWVF